MEMGVKYTGVWIREKTVNNETIEHYVIVTNGVARSLRTGNDVCIKLELFK
jgi:hypothetical protein